jgi:hypothetical protein
MKDKKLRSMLADCIKEHKKRYGYRYERPYTLKTICDVNTSHTEVTLEYLIDCAENQCSDFKDIMVSGYSQDDYDGYPEYFVQMQVKVKATDAEWFEEISDYLSPQHELRKWNQYLALKKEFE